MLLDSLFDWFNAGYRTVNFFSITRLLLRVLVSQKIAYDKALSSPSASREITDPYDNITVAPESAEVREARLQTANADRVRQLIADWWRGDEARKKVLRKKAKQKKVFHHLDKAIRTGNRYSSAKVKKEVDVKKEVENAHT
ncbi:hypothetical protein B0A55_10043 [Friedmanniomyces simplex]|uniref:Uncharacterized protein n=1 Tax=Friedmanniomyces simplex TaxID=329884 RepID=A0A4U0XHP9_9PEZI|nr:hypothetical protein B0A55_10043 [Friedmanniomyces simplex]